MIIIKKKNYLILFLALVIFLIGIPIECKASTIEDTELVNVVGCMNENNEKIKKEIDNSNKELKETYESLAKTKNGVIIYKSSDIKKIDELNQRIILLEELLRKKKNGNINDFREIKYPLASEIEQYGVLSGYTDSFNTNKFFDKKVNEEYKSTLVEYDFFKDISFEEFIEAIEIFDFINLENTQIIFNPYRILSSYAYCESYTPRELKNRRTRIYFNPNDGEDIIPTLYHELGHMVYNELVANNKENYNKYWNIYKEEINQKGQVIGPEISWANRLTENFAEDFKIYVTKRIIAENRENKQAKDLLKYITKNKKSFLEKDTAYPKKKEVFSYFDNLLKEYEIKEVEKEIKATKVKTNTLRPNIVIELQDYENPFMYRDSSYLNNYVNKIVTNSNVVILNFENLNQSELKLKRINVIKWDKDMQKSLGEKEYELKEEKFNIPIEIEKTNNIYEIKIELESNTNNENIKYKEDIIFYLIK